MVQLLKVVLFIATVYKHVIIEKHCQNTLLIRYEVYKKNKKNFLLNKVLNLKQNKIIFEIKVLQLELYLFKKQIKIFTYN